MPFGPVSTLSRSPGAVRRKGLDSQSGGCRLQRCRWPPGVQPPRLRSSLEALTPSMVFSLARASQRRFVTTSTGIPRPRFHTVLIEARQARACRSGLRRRVPTRCRSVCHSRVRPQVLYGIRKKTTLFSLRRMRRDALRACPSRRCLPGPEVKQLSSEDIQYGGRDWTRLDERWGAPLSRIAARY